MFPHATGHRSVASHDTETFSPATKARPTNGTAATIGSVVLGGFAAFRVARPPLRWVPRERLMPVKSDQQRRLDSAPAAAPLGAAVGAQLGIPIVVPEGVGAVVATPPVGAMVAVPPTVGVIEPILPAPEILSYVTQQAVEPVLVDGEVMVGATLPAAVPVYPIPASPYVYSYINGQRVLVEPAARRIVYVVQ